MGRTTSRIELTSVLKESIARKRAAFAEAGQPRYADRCRAVELCAGGWELADIARGLGRPYKTVQEWLREFRKQGVRSLYVKPRSGRPRELGEHERMLLDKAIQRGPRACGYQGGVWTSPMVADYIKRRWHVDYTPAHVRKILHALGFSLQFPREKLALADQKKQAHWLKHTLPRIKKKRASDEPS